MTDDQCTPPADNVVQLTDVFKRVYKPKECRHARLEVDDNNRRIACLDCEREIDPFEAILVLADKTSEWQTRWDAMRKDWRNLAQYVPRLLAVRELESMWSGNRLPLCPHCKQGVTAEGLNKMGWVHKAYAEAVQQHKRDAAPESSPPVALHEEKADV